MPYDYTAMNARRDEIADTREHLRLLEDDQTAEVILAFGQGEPRPRLEKESGYAHNTVWLKTLSPEARDRIRAGRRTRPHEQEH
jgi:hypothetical protein